MRIEIPKLIIAFCFFLSLIRGTNVGLFYPSDEFQIGQIDYTFQIMTNFVLLGGVLSYFFFKNEYGFFKKAFSNPLIVLLLAGAAASAVFSVDTAQSVKFIFVVTVISLPTILFQREFGSEKLIAALAIFTAAMAFINLAYVVVFPDYGIMVGHHAGRWRGIFEHKNGAGQFFSIGFYVIASQISLLKPVRSLVYGLAMVICILFVIFAQSATGAVEFFLTGFVYAILYFLYRLRNSKERISMLLLAFGSALFIYTFFGQVIMDEFFALTGKDPTLTGRTVVWGVLFDMISHRPLLGYGAGMAERMDFMEQIQGNVGWEVKGSHNSYIDIILGCGYPTAFFMVFVLLNILVRSFFINVKTKTNLHLMCMAASLVIVMMIIDGASAGGMYSRSIFWLFNLIGITVLAQQINMHRAENRVSADA